MSLHLSSANKTTLKRFLQQLCKKTQPQELPNELPSRNVFQHLLKTSHSEEHRCLKNSFVMFKKKSHNYIYTRATCNLTFTFIISFNISIRIYAKLLSLRWHNKNSLAYHKIICWNPKFFTAIHKEQNQVWVGGM